MPRKEVCAMDQRLEFVRLAEQEGVNFSISKMAKFK
jgi:hypothetical protein